jgi:hypothetical protein
MSGSKPAKPVAYFALSVNDCDTIMANFADRQRDTAMTVYVALCRLAFIQGGAKNSTIRARIVTVADAARLRYRATANYLHALQKLDIIELRMSFDADALNVITLTWKAGLTSARPCQGTSARNYTHSVPTDKNKRYKKEASTKNNLEYARS